MDGFAVAHNMPELPGLPLDRFCNFVWWIYTRNGDEKSVEKLRRLLWQPPKGVEVTDARSPWSAENEQKAFGALKASLGLSGKSSA